LARTIISRIPSEFRGALGTDSHGKFLAGGYRLGSDLAGRVDSVLRLDCVDDLGNRYAQVARRSGLTQSLMAYSPAPNTVTLAMPATRVIWSLMLIFE